jgi:hypothetical protein
MSSYVQVGFLVSEAATSTDLAHALQSIARLLETKGTDCIGKDYTVGKMTVQIRQR